MCFVARFGSKAEQRFCSLTQVLEIKRRLMNMVSKSLRVSCIYKTLLRADSPRLSSRPGKSAGQDLALSIHGTIQMSAYLKKLRRVRKSFYPILVWKPCTMCIMKMSHKCFLRRLSIETKHSGKAFMR